MKTSKKLSVLALAALMSAGVMTASIAHAGEAANSWNAKVKADANKCTGMQKPEANKCTSIKKPEANMCNGLKQSDFND